MENSKSTTGLVSVVVPVYNVEKYLRTCVDSVLGQSFQGLEVILVDDGSTDDCPQICDDYARQNSCVRVIHQKNAGLSFARNRGFEQAQGEYVYFLDSDDYLAPGAIQKLYDKAVSDMLDVLLFDDVPVDEKGEWDEGPHRQSSRKGLYEDVYTGRALFSEMRQNADYRANVQILFIRRKTLQECGLMFFEGILHEDVLFTFLLLMQSKRCGHLPEPLLCKRKRSGSIMTTPQTEKNVESCLVGLEVMAGYCLENEFEKVYEGSIRDYLADVFWNTYTRYQNLKMAGREVDSSLRKRLFVCMKTLNYLGDTKISRRCRFDWFYAFCAKASDLKRRVKRRLRVTPFSLKR